MDFYIALGGVGCRVLKDYSAKYSLDRQNCFYIDTNADDLEFLLDKQDNRYVVPRIKYGSGIMRHIGQNAMKYEIYSGKLAPFFEGIRNAKNPSLTFITTSFGGFGSSAVVEVVDYVEALVWENGNINCRVIAFNESYLRNSMFGIPNELANRFEENSMQTINDFCAHYVDVDIKNLCNVDNGFFNPVCKFYMIDTKNMELSEFYTVLEKDESEIAALDVRKKYTVKPKKSSESVFISYSSKDERVANMLTESLSNHDIGCWIASESVRKGSTYAKQIVQGIHNAKIFVVILSKNSVVSEHVKNEIDRAFSRIKDGLKIIPFMIDDAELDDECSYYLCRQEMMFGNYPPIMDRINELASDIAQMLD